MTERKAKVVRETAETNVKMELNIDGNGQFQITTGIRMFDHLLTQLAQHGVFDMRISASGPDQHHVVEDVAISLGKALNQALGKSRALSVWRMPSCLWMRLWQRWLWTSEAESTA